MEFRGISGIIGTGVGRRQHDFFVVISSKKCTDRIHKLLRCADTGVLELLGVFENVSPKVQFSLGALFCLALGFAAFSLTREQSKIFGVVALVVGLFWFISPGVRITRSSTTIIASRPEFKRRSFVALRCEPQAQMTFIRHQSATWLSPTGDFTRVPGPGRDF